MITIHRNRTPRRGFTLREVSIAIAFGSTVMMAAVALVHHAFGWSTLAQHRRTDDQSFFNLSGQLRSDLHLSKQASVNDQDDSTGVVLALTTDSGNEVVYTISQENVSRHETSDGDTIRHEFYRWKRPRKLWFSKLDADNQIQLNVKSVTPFPESEVPMWRSVRASIGLRLRHQNGDIDS